MDNKNGYSYHKKWFDFIAETEEMVTPMHTALYLWIVELNNRLQWCPVVGLPTDRTMGMCRIKSYKWYKRTLDDLIKWGFLELKEKSHNQHTCNQVALVLETKAVSKQTPKQDDLPEYYRPKQLPHNKTVKTKEQTIKNSKNLKEDEAIFFLKIFKEEYEEIKEITYVVTEADKTSIIEFLNLYKQATGETDNEKLEFDIKDYFRAIIKHPEDFHRERMTLQYLVKNFNTINNSLFTGKSLGINSFWERKEVRKNFEVKKETPVIEEPELTPPTLEEISQFFLSNSYSVEGAEECHKYFTLWKWKAKGGRCFIPDWKERAKECFFKPEYSFKLNTDDPNF